MLEQPAAIEQPLIGPSAGIVYVLSNPAMDGYIKIGRVQGNTTSDVTQRMRTLDTTGVPLAFDCEYAAVVSDAARVESALHNAFGDYRARSNREFFYRLAPHRVKAVLKLSALEEVTPTEDDELTEEVLVSRARRPSFNFRMVNIPVGAVLQWADDPQIECTVDDERTYVQYDDKRWAISTLARELKGWKRTPAGPLYWLYEGETLQERRERFDQG